MIDVHCHLEWKDYEKDRDEVISKCKQKLKAVITSCAHPKNLDLTLDLVKKYKGFVFAQAGLHPTYVKEISEEQVDEYIEKIRENKKYFVAIGETGLDYSWVKDEKLREKTRAWFLRFVELSKELNLPLVVHSRDAPEETIEILGNLSSHGDISETGNIKVLWHMFMQKPFMEQVLERGWYISVGPLILRSKGIRKIVRDFPFERILLETDSPWFGVPEDYGRKYAQGGTTARISEGANVNEKMFKVRGYPWNIKYAAEKIAEIRKVSFEEVWETCGRNAVRFFDLKVKI